MGEWTTAGWLATFVFFGLFGYVCYYIYRKIKNQVPKDLKDTVDEIRKIF